MRRRRFLTLTAATTTLTALAGCTQSGEREGTESTDDPGSQPTTDTTSEPSMTETPSDDGPSETTSGEGAAGESDMEWGSGGRMNGVPFSFTSRSPECGQGADSADVSFDDATGEVTVDGVISGSDLCKRAQLASVEHDTEADLLSVTVETTDRSECQNGDVAAGQCIVDIEYEATFSFEDGLPGEVSVSHGESFGVTAAHDSASADPAA